jgi:hypothetical protein
MASTDISGGFPTPIPKPFTQEEYEAWVLQASADERQIKSGARKVKEGLWEIGEALYRFNSSSGWLALGYDTLGDWLADPDVTMARSTYFRLIGAWQELAIIREIPVSTLRQLDLSKVAIALPALKRGETTTEDLLADVEVMGARDLRVKYRGEAEVVSAEEEISDEPDFDPEAPLPDVHYDDISENGDGPDSYGVESVGRGLAATLTIVLEAVLRELGAPERKTMSKQLRAQVTQVLELAHQEGLGDG